MEGAGEGAGDRETKEEDETAITIVILCCLFNVLLCFKRNKVLIYYLLQGNRQKNSI